MLKIETVWPKCWELNYISLYPHRRVFIATMGMAKHYLQNLSHKMPWILRSSSSTQQTFQRWFNVVFRSIWRRDVAQRQTNFETTLCTSTLKFTTFNNVETMLCFSTLNWTTLDNVVNMTIRKKKLNLYSKTK